MPWHIPKKKPSQAEYWRMLSRPRQELQPGQGVLFVVVDKNRVAASKPCQVRLGGIKVKEINRRPAPSPNAGMLQAHGRWLQDWAPIETGAQPGQVGNKMKRVLSSGWGHRRHFLHLPSFFKGHKDMGSGQTYGEHLSAASHPGCPHSPVTLPTRIPRNSCNLWHCLAVSV